MSRSIRRRALLAAALPAAAAAFALPSAATAATAEVVNAGGNGILGYSAAPGEINNVRVSVANGKLVIADAAPITAGNGCTVNVQGDAECSIGVASISMFLSDKNDTVQYIAPHFGSVSGENGDDIVFAGLRQAAPGRPIQPVFYLGNAGRDQINYAFADRGVRVDTDDNPGGGRIADGRPGIDLESVGRDVEQIEGSNFPDVLFGSAGNDRIFGRNGNDEIGGGEGNDFFFEDQGGPNGADSINGGGGIDRVSYAGRERDVNVSLDGIRNDGESGENDDVRPNVENVTSGNGDDVLVGNSLANDFDPFGGNDNLTGAGGDDTLTAGSGNNRLAGGAGNDVLSSRNGELDNIECGDSTDIDTADRDSVENRVIGCERGVVGVLRLMPKAVSAKAGKPARLALSWRHPRGWRQLRGVELRLMQDDVPVGEITIRPRSERITDDGAVGLVHRSIRLTPKGKTVTARFAVRLDESLAGQTLQADVEATDRRGRRQLERDAATVRVAG